MKEVANCANRICLFCLPNNIQRTNERKKRKEIYSRKKGDEELLTPNSTFQFQKDFQNFSGQSGEFFLSFPGGNFFFVLPTFSTFRLKFLYVHRVTNYNDFQFHHQHSRRFFGLDNKTLSDFKKNQQICTLGLFFFVCSCRCCLHEEKKKLPLQTCSTSAKRSRLRTSSLFRGVDCS